MLGEVVGSSVIMTASNANVRKGVVIQKRVCHEASEIAQLLGVFDKKGEFPART